MSSAARRRSASIRVRLAAGSAVVAAVLLTALALLVAGQVRAVADRTATELAVADLRPYAVDLLRNPDEEPDPSAAGLLILVADATGAVRHDSMPARLSRAVRTVAGVGDVQVAGGRYRVVERDVTTASGTWRLWAARDLTAGDLLVGGTMTTLLIGVPVAVLVTAVAAYLVAGLALRPVERMRAAADRLRAPGAAEVLPARGGDELAALAVTLNGLIQDLRAAADHERRITADAAHELRTPLAVLAAQVELAARRPDAADLPAIRGSVGRLTRVADDLLVLSRMERAPRGSTGSATVAALVTEGMDAVDRARLLAAEAVTVDLELDGAIDEAATVAMDPVLFGRVLANLIGNALTAGPASAVRIRLGLRGDALEVEVADDGPGVPPAFLPLAFERFSRPDGRQAAATPGAGLGLAIVRLAAERAGGTASLRNGEHGGAVATVLLPVVPVVFEVSNAARADAQVPAAEAERARP